jgi:hypothetical protein
MKVSITLFFLFLVAFSLETKAQKFKLGFQNGYVVKNNNDTLYGLVAIAAELRGIFEDVRFKKSEKSELFIFSPKEVKFFSIDNDFYYSKSIAENKMAFFTLLVNDSLSMYKHFSGGMNTSKNYILLEKKADGSIFSYVPSNFFFPFRKKIADFLKEDIELCKKIKSNVYNQTHINKIVRLYNEYLKGIERKLDY